MLKRADWSGRSEKQTRSKNMIQENELIFLSIL